MATGRPIKFTPKQQRFIDAYDGNATKAARIAGYKDPRSMGSENLAKPDVAAAIRHRENENREKTIATRQERQQFWSDVMNGQEAEEEDAPSMKDRLKASELLGKSEADFTERIEQGGSVTVKIVKYGEET